MSSSRTSSTTTPTQIDRRVVIGEGGINAQDGSSVFVQALDGQVLNRALGSVDTATGEAFAFGAESLSKAFGFGADSLDLVNDVFSGALSFGRGVTTQALDFGSESLAFADAAGRRADTNIAAAYRDANAVSSAALDDAFAFGSSALDRGFATLRDSQTIVADAYADAKGRGAMTDKILIGAVIAVAVVAFAAVQK